MPGALLSTLLVVLLPGFQQALARSGQEGRVVGAPHDGFDRHTGEMAGEVAAELGWGLVVASGFRSQPDRLWLDVNRPTERPYRLGRFQSERRTRAGERAYDEYQARLFAAGGGARPLELLVEVHGHTRAVRAGGRQVEVDAIELATSGFTLAELRDLRAAYERLAAALPPDLRVDLAIDRLDDPYRLGPWWIPFYFQASGAKRQGSLRPAVARRALHFELPPRARESARARRAYAALLAELLRGV